MHGKPCGVEIDVLLIEGNPRYARRVQLLLSEARGAMEVRGGLFAVTHVTRLEHALELLAEKNAFGVVLLDLQLPDSEGVRTLSRIRDRADSVPVIVLTGIDDDGLALAVIQQGAQDWLAMDDLDGRLFVRTIRHAIERKRTEVELLRHAREVEAARARIEQQAAELRARAEQLDKANRELDDFTYIASHDLKEPLRGISAYCEILREDYDDKLDADGRRRLESLAVMCDRLCHLIDDLLTYCRVGRVPSPDARVDLNEVTTELLGTLRAAIDQRGASVEVVGQLPVVRGEATLLGMVLANLISNGLKYNKNPRPCVEIGVLADDPRTVYVRDNGIGIPKKHHEVIFTIFRRLHGRKEYEGTGAGLTIVRKIVESCGGRVWLESEPDRGATFFFHLPSPRKSSPTRQPTKPPHWISRAVASPVGKSS